MELKTFIAIASISLSQTSTAIFAQQIEENYNWALNDPRVPRAFEVNVQMSQTVFREIPTVVHLQATRRIELSPLETTWKTPDDYAAATLDERREVSLLSSLVHTRFCQFDILTEHPLPVSIEVQSQDGNVLQSAQPPSELAFFSHLPASPGPQGPDKFDYPRPFVTLVDPRTHSWWFNPNPWLIDLPDGEYIIAIKLHNWPHNGWRSNEVKIVLKSIDHDSWRLLRTAVPSLPEEITSFPPQKWANMPVDVAVFNLIKERLGPDLRLNLEFWVALRSLVQAAHEPDAALDFSSHVPAYLQRLINLLKYEVFLFRRDDHSATALREQVLKEFPDLRPQFVKAATKEGILHRLLPTSTSTGRD